MKNNKDLFIGIAVIALVCGGVFYYSVFYPQTPVVADAPTEHKVVTAAEVDDLMQRMGDMLIANKNKRIAEGGVATTPPATQNILDVIIAQNTNENARLAAHQAEENALNVDKAIRAGKVILGMSERQVLQAKGYPTKVLDGDEIYRSWREQGVVEVWHYGDEAHVVHGTDIVLQPDFVAFNRDSNVVGATDIP
jgi:hypothetical protein